MYMLASPDERPADNPLRGFTLIELLVVIAIIGLLSSVVLASLHVSQQKAQNAAIAQTVSQMLTESVIYYDNHGNYSSGTQTGIMSLSCNDPELANSVFSLDHVMASELQTLLNNSPIVYCGVTGSLYHQKQFMLVALQNPGGANSKWWCIDSNGDKRLVSSFGMDVSTGCPAN